MSTTFVVMQCGYTPLEAVWFAIAWIPKVCRHLRTSAVSKHCGAAMDQGWLHMGKSSVVCAACMRCIYVYAVRVRVRVREPWTRALQ